MSVIVRNMEMPKDGTFSIVHIYSDGHVSMPSWGKGMQIVNGITAVPVPPHGRLIDADALMLRVDMHGTNKYGMLDEDIRQFVNAAPTIIPAEE